MLQPRLSSAESVRKAVLGGGVEPWLISSAVDDSSTQPEPMRLHQSKHHSVCRWSIDEYHAGSSALSSEPPNL
jgi:hypothetical protein